MQGSLGAVALLSLLCLPVLLSLARDSSWCVLLDQGILSRGVARRCVLDAWYACTKALRGALTIVRTVGTRSHGSVLERRAPRRARRRSFPTEDARAARGIRSGARPPSPPASFRSSCSTGTGTRTAWLVQPGAAAILYGFGYTSTSLTSLEYLVQLQL